MSLFQAREWWSHKPDAAEECHSGSLVVANIDNDPKGAEKVVTGSFQGVLRIFTPRQQGYRVDDLMEFQLDEPILQIEAGRFVNQGNKLSLAVLHPRKLVVYNVVAIGANGKMVASSTTEQASYYDLNKAYEHKLERTAYNFCYGPFGGVYGKDFICVQSMDGQLSFLEQENFAFSRFLSNFLLPGPLCYVAKIDCFVTVNSNMDVEAYKYHILGSSHGAEKKNDDQPSHLEHAPVEKDASATTGSNSKKIQVDFSVNLGEHIQSIFVARYSRSLAASNVDILVLGEHTLFTLKENGTIRLQKRLDFDPSCAVTYQNSELADGEKDVGGSNQNLIIATHQNSCMIYKDMQLVWAARTQSVPVAVRVATFAGIRGFLVTLNDICEVQVSFLGTDPPVNGVSAADSAKELDYEAMDEEHRALLKVIKQASTDSMVEPKEKITLRAQVTPTLAPGDGTSSGEIYMESADSSKGAADEDVCVKDERTGAFVQILVRLYIQYNGKADIENLSIALSHSPAFRSSSGRQILLPLLRGSSKTPVILTLRFRCIKGILPADLGLSVVASYVTANNEPRTARLETALPLALAAKIIPPLKNCAFMFTLDSNRNPPPPQDTFGDLLEPAASSNPEIARTSANVLTFYFYGTQCDVTILTSQKTGRYRLQSSVFEALNLITSELHQRLHSYYAGQDAKLASVNQRSDQPPFKLLFKDQHLPLADYFLLIDKHFETRQRLIALRASLEKFSHQFRVIQKRLLVRYKDKNPAPLLQLDTLMAETYQQLQDQGAESSKLQASLRETSGQLSSATNLMLHLIRFKYDLDDANMEVLHANMTPIVSLFDNTSDPRIGWEECVDSALTNLLRTVLAKGGGKESAALATVAQPIENMQDVGKLKKHIQIVCDRLAKGLRLVKKEKSAEKSAAPSRPAVPSQPSAGPPKSIPTPSQQQAPEPPQRRRKQQQQEEVLQEEGEEEGQ